MPKPLEEIQGLLDELDDWQKAAAADPQEVGSRLRQQIIDRANDLTSSTGDFAPVVPAGSSREVIEQVLAEWRHIKSEASTIRLWAIHNLPIPRKDNA